MHQLTSIQRALLDQVTEQLKPVSGITAVVLGGSHARGRARADSDLDIGLYYEPARRFDIGAIRDIAARLNDTPDPVVSGFGDWGRWVDGGAWLTVGGQRVDLLYRSLEKVEHTLAEARAGRFEIDFEQQAPFGFFGPTLLGEVAVAAPLHDPAGRIMALKSEVSPMPAALADAVVQNRLWSAEFGLKAFAPKFASSGDVHGLAGCLTRIGQALVLSLFALNRVYPLNDKTALAEVSAFERVPPRFGPRLNGLLARIGSQPADLASSLTALGELFGDVRALAGGSYTPVYRL